MPKYEKHFTLVEANALIPWVRSVFDKARHILAQAREEVAVSQSEAVIGPIHGNGNGNGGKPNGASLPSPSVVVQLKGPSAWQPDLNLKIHHLTSQEKIDLINQILQKVWEEGIVIRDVDRGLIDFPAILEGEEVFLCYEESDGLCVTHWHALDEGFANRQALGGDFDETGLED